MTEKPHKSVFVSATSPDLRRYRQVARDALLDFGILPKVQEHFPPDYRELTQFLKETITQCDAMVCLVGRVFGEQPHGQNRKVPRSYSQIEYDVARKARKPIYVFFAADDCKLDAVPEEDEEKKAWQEAHRQALKDSHKCEKFASDTDLYKLIAKMIPTLERDALLAKLTSYFDKLKTDAEFATWTEQRYFELQVGGKIGDFSIRLSPKHLPGSNAADPKSRYEIQEALEKFGQLVIIGDPGSGKTTALKRLALNYAHACRREIERDRFDNNSPVPVYIWLPDFNLMRGDTPYDRLVALIRDAFQRHEAFNANDVNTLLRSFSLALLLDGHNEMGDKNLKEFQEGLKKYARTHKRHPLIITSRTYDSEFGAYELPVFELRELRYPEDFEQYIGCYLKDQYDVRRLMKILESNLRIRQLAGNPLLLRMIIMVFQFEGVVPNNRGMLFQKIAYGLLSGEFGTDVNRRPSYWFRDKHVLLNQLGYAMKEEGLELSTKRAEEIFEETLNLNAVWFSVDNSERPPNFHPPDHAANWQRFLDELKEDHLLFQRTDGKAVRFWHQTMQEYFAACRIRDEVYPLIYADHEPVQSTYAIRKVLKRKLSHYINDKRWHEILAITAGLVPTHSMIVRFIDTIWQQDKLLSAMCLSNVERFDAPNRLDAYLKYIRNEILVWGIILPRMIPWVLLAILLAIVWLIPQARAAFLLSTVKNALALSDVALQVMGISIAVTFGIVVSLAFFRLCAFAIERFDAFTNKTFVGDGILSLRYIRNINQVKTEALLARFQSKIENDFSIGELTRNTIETGLVLPQRDQFELIEMLNDEDTRLQALEGLGERGNRTGMLAIENLIKGLPLDNLTYGTAVKAITRIAKSLSFEDPARQKLKADLRKVLANGESYGRRRSAYWALIELGVTDLEPPRRRKLFWISIVLVGLMAVMLVVWFYF